MVYLIHFTKKFKHAKHYIGAVNGGEIELNKRLFHHRRGTGSKLLRAVSKEGINWYVSRTWEGGFDLEKQLKSLKNSKSLCPVCNKKKKYDKQNR